MKRFLTFFKTHQGCPACLSLHPLVYAATWWRNYRCADTLLKRVHDTSHSVDRWHDIPAIGICIYNIVNKSFSKHMLPCEIEVNYTESLRKIWLCGDRTCRWTARELRTYVTHTRACMHACVHMHTHVYTCMHTHTHVYEHTFVHTHVSAHAHINTYIYKHLHTTCLFPFKSSLHSTMYFGHCPLSKPLFLNLSQSIYDGLSKSCWTDSITKHPHVFVVGQCRSIQSGTHPG